MSIPFGLFTDRTNHILMNHTIYYRLRQDKKIIRDKGEYGKEGWGEEELNG